MTPTGGVLWESNITHEPGRAVADFNISLPQTVDVCSLHVRIRAGNSAGMSALCEAVEVVCSGDSTDSMTTTASTTTGSTASSSRSGSEGNSQQGNSTTLIVVLIAVIATIGVVEIVAAAAGIIYCRKQRKYMHNSTNVNKPAGTVGSVAEEEPAD